MTPEDELHSLLIAARGLRRKQVELSARLDRLAGDDDRPLMMTGFAASVAGDVGNLAQAFMARTEAKILDLHLDRDLPADRERAAREALIQWRNEGSDDPDNLPTADYERVINDFVPSGGRDTNPDLRKGHSSRALDALSYGSPGSNPAKRWEPKVSNVLIQHLEYGSHSLDAEAERLGGMERVHHLRRIAAARKLDLKRPAGRAVAEQALWREIGSPLRLARCFDEAVASVIRDRKLTFSEGSQADAARVVMKERPDLLTEYGQSRLIPTSADIQDPAATKFAERVQSVLRDMPDKYEPDAEARATREAMKRWPKSIPSHYGSRRRSK
jgi:hypothetical protein